MFVQQRPVIRQYERRVRHYAADATRSLRGTRGHHDGQRPHVLPAGKQLTERGPVLHLLAYVHLHPIQFVDHVTATPEPLQAYGRLRPAAALQQIVWRFGHPDGGDQKQERHDGGDGVQRAVRHQRSDYGLHQEAEVQLKAEHASQGPPYGRRRYLTQVHGHYRVRHALAHAGQQTGGVQRPGGGYEQRERPRDDEQRP